jgi:hypothetical protein
VRLRLPEDSVTGAATRCLEIASEIVSCPGQLSNGRSVRVTF